MLGERRARRWIAGPPSGYDARRRAGPSCRDVRAATQCKGRAEHATHRGATRLAIEYE